MHWCLFFQHMSTLTPFLLMRPTFMWSSNQPYDIMLRGSPCCAVLGERINAKGRVRFSQMGQSSAGIRALPPELRVSKVLRRCQGQPSFVGGYARLAVTAASATRLSVYATTSKLECPLECGTSSESPG
jgi:hypothetical protein